MSYCPVCKQSTWNVYNAPHRCAPLWYVWEEAEASASRIYADDAEHAARKYLTIMGHDTYCSEVTAFVRQLGSDRVELFYVTMDMVPEYNATLLQEFKGPWTDVPIYVRRGVYYVCISETINPEGFREWLKGQTCPVISGIDDAAFPHDYERYVKGLPIED
jgi:hypothetical protein